MIPKQLQNQDFRFIILKKKKKEPIEKDWQGTNNYKHSDPKLQAHLDNGGNSGIIGGFGNLILIDADSEEINEVCKQLPNTFTIKTGSPEAYKNHYYFITGKEMKPIRLSKEKVGDIGDIRSTGQYVVAPNSIHPSGNKYEVVKDIPIAKTTIAFVESIFKDYINLISSDDNGAKIKNNFPVDTKKRLSDFTKICNVPDYVLNNKMPENISKNNKLFPYVIDVLNARDVSDSLYEKLAEVQDHNLSAVSGWVKNAKEGTLAKTSCKKMLEYLNHYAPEIVEEICGKCKLYQKAKEEVEKKKEEELKQKLFEEHKEKISKDRDVNALLQNPDIFEIIDEEFDKKITGERKSRRAIFLSCCSIWVKNIKINQNLLVSSESSVGKSFVSKRIVQIFPKELYVYRTKITPEAFTYWKQDEDWDWDGKICYLEDISQGILDAPTFKIMCSEGSIATVVIKQKAVDIEIQGSPVMLVTTASTSPNSEILNRFQIIGLDESKEQTEDITLNQALELKDEGYDEKITDSLRLLERVNVTIPFALHVHSFISQSYNWNDVRMRRDFSRLLNLIKCSASLHQKMRKRNEQDKIIATEQDYEIARECINHIETTTLKGLTHKLKKAYDFCVKEQEFTAKDIHSKHPFVSQRMWYDYLDGLCERNLLTTELRSEEESKKRITWFFVPKSTSFALPEYNELIKIKMKNKDKNQGFASIVSNASLPSNASIVSNDTKKVGTNETNETNEREISIKNKKAIDSDGLDWEDEQAMEGKFKIKK